ncbi:hypothetical protein GOV07_04150 [Candidatus Woesearchaeota archaeon]|nr:hypothetical protein [Candidatus Woesearchaeota archaeon]
MKKTFLVLFIALFVIASCTTPTVKGIVDQDARVQTFLELFPEATYVESAYNGAKLDAIRDVVVQDCGQQEVPDSIVRATYVTEAANLAAYVSGNEVFCVASKLNQEAFAIQKGDPTTVDAGTLVTINGIPITQQHLEAAVAALPEAARAETSLGGVLNTLADQELLRQAAATVVVTPEEVETASTEAWTNAGFADKVAFSESLAAQGISYDEYLVQVEAQLKLNKLLDEQGVTNVDVNEDQVRDFYLQNTNSFLVSEQTRFRQIFLSYNLSGGEQGAATRLQNVLDQINDGLNFCDAVKRYSDDEQSKELCGEYVAARGVLLPELEASIFSLGVNQSTISVSPNGYHIIVVLEKQQASVIPYAQAASQVEGLLKNQLMQQRLNIYLLKLRATAEMIDYSQ